MDIKSSEKEIGQLVVVKHSIGSKMEPSSTFEGLKVFAHGDKLQQKASHLETHLKSDVKEIEMTNDPVKKQKDKSLVKEQKTNMMASHLKWWIKATCFREKFVDAVLLTDAWFRYAIDVLSNYDAAGLAFSTMSCTDLDVAPIVSEVASEMKKWPRKDGHVMKNVAKVKSSDDVDEDSGTFFCHFSCSSFS